MKQLKQEELKNYIGKYIYAVKADGTKINGKLVAVKDGRAYISPTRSGKGKEVTTNWIFGLLLAGVIFWGLVAWSYCCRPIYAGCCGRRFGSRRRRCCCGRFHHYKNVRRRRRTYRRRRYRYA